MHARAPPPAGGPGDPRPAASTSPPPPAPRAHAGPSHSTLDTLSPPTRRPATLAPARTRPSGAAVSLTGSSSAENTAEEVREDSGGAGNETDVEDEDGMGDESPSTGDEPPRAPHDHHHHHPHLAPFSAAMYPFPSGDAEASHLHYGPMHYRRRSMHAAPPSSAEVLLSSATTESSASEADDAAADAARPARPTKRHRMRSVDLAQQPPLQHPRVPRLRRIGALGISVHSDSDPDEPNISGLDSVDRLPERNTGGSTSDVTRATDLGIDSDMLRKSHGDGSPATAAGGLQSCTRKRRPVGDATCRGVVDELAVQNRELRERLRRYEVDGVPNELKQDRLFEIRFYEGLPARKRVELEDYLTRYVQTYAESAVEPPEPELAGPAARVRFENSTLAGPSNSGLEPPSLSGTGSGIRLPPLAHPVHPATIPHLDGSAVISDPRSVAIAREIVSSLETLFQSSLLRTTRTRTPASASIPLPQLDPSRLLPGALDASNEKYFANLLSHDFLSQGFVYLNLCLTMAQIYRFNVTVAFVQRAVRQFSHNLELSDDGGRIRWKGPRSPAVVDDAALDVEMGDLVEFVKAGDKGKGKAREPDSVDGASSAPSRSTRASGSRDPSSGASSSLDPSVGTGTLLADSLAPSSRTGQTSLPSTGRKTSSAEPLRPVRPTAAVLQPMDRLQLSASPEDITSRTPPEGKVERATARAAPTAPTAAVIVAAADEPVEPVERKDEQQHDKASSGKDGSDALSAANLDAHNLGIDLVESLRTHASSQAVASTTTSSGKNAVGALVFYGNGLFCSDLSKEGEGPVTPPILPPKGELVSRPLGALDEDEDEVDEEPSALVDPEAMDVDDEESPIDLDSAVLDVVGDERRAARSSSEGDGSGSGSGTSSLQRLRMSGMTPTFPADFFTVVVKTRHPLKRSAADTLPTPDSPGQVHGARAPSFSTILPASKRPRLAPAFSSEVLSTREIYHHPRVQIRRALVPTTAAGAESNSASSVDGDDDAAHGPWSYGQLLTSSNLAKHSGGRTAAARPMSPIDEPVAVYLPPTPSPPHHDQGDYLLSLSAPSHSWSPEESGFHTSGSGSLAVPAVAPAHHRKQGASPSLSLSTSTMGGGPVQRVKRSGGPASSTPPSSSADERPISLDDDVDVPQRPRLVLP
ncbi:hypothetical protein JCM9279_000333 [Rhodotorula babjevae]